MLLTATRFVSPLLALLCCLLLLPCPNGHAAPLCHAARRKPAPRKTSPKVVIKASAMRQEYRHGKTRTILLPKR